MSVVQEDVVFTSGESRVSYRILSWKGCIVRGSGVMVRLEKKDYLWCNLGFLWACYKGGMQNGTVIQHADYQSSYSR